MFLTIIAIAGGSYLLGSFPTAYLLVKWKTKLDIREAGSGNVGALNSYEVSRSKLVGVAVLLIDLMKGALAVLVARHVSAGAFLDLAVAPVSVVLGHNFPLWLHFKGGRGLAPAAGAFLVINWLFVMIWCMIWALKYWRTKDIHKGNILAIVLLPITAILLSGTMVDWGFLEAQDAPIFVVSIALICTLLFLKHVQPLKQILLEGRKERSVVTTNQAEEDA